MKLRERPPDMTAAARARGGREVQRKNIAGTATTRVYADSRPTAGEVGLAHYTALFGAARAQGPKPWQIRTTPTGGAIVFLDYEAAP